MKQFTSDGDQQMLEYTDQGDGPRLVLIVHHDDGEREVARDRTSKIGKLGSAWNEAKGTAGTWSA